MRRASLSILASGCAFVTTACRLSTPSDNPNGQFAAALNRLSDEMKANLGRLETQMNANARDVRTQMYAFDAKVNALDAKVNALDAKVNALDANVKAQMKDVRTDVRTQIEKSETRITSNTQEGLLMNQRFIMFCIACILALFYLLDVKVVRALELSELAS
ncbi:membrane-associated protein, putative [Bodo saltans]|uniref:Membrane-associated protein, putative n=1 Tax=Bodo saltans TaxID=75058 RepID=A0A0S4KI52_BODSA|nr:membrane-associated protein, putative [Bodo saltans]|eukprot:CUI12830.1 membrane-associated protein, putative [Bodo saltans]